MKKLIFITAILLSIVSCEHDMPFNVKENQPKLVVNALLDATKEENEITLALTGRDRISDIEDAQIDIYVNGMLKEHITTPAEKLQAKGYSRYKTRIRFVEGDVMRIEVVANKGQYNAWSEVTVPKPVSIDKIDISEYTKQLNQYSPLQYVRARTTFTDDGKGRNYYRIAMSFDFELEMIDSYNQRDTTVFQTVSTSLVTNEDVVLTDGKPSVNDKDDDIFASINNEYGVFDNARINGTYLMTTSMQIPYYYAGAFGMESHIPGRIKRVKINSRVKLMSISKTQYYYLKALNIYDSVDFDNFVNLPVKFPSNIEGGTGVFGVSIGSVVVVGLKDYVPDNDSGLL